MANQSLVFNDQEILDSKNSISHQNEEKLARCKQLMSFAILTEDSFIRYKRDSFVFTELSTKSLIQASYKLLNTLTPNSPKQVEHKQ